MNTSKVAEIQITYSNPIPVNDRRRIISSRDTYVLMKELWDEGMIELREEFKVVLLNRANEVLGFYNLSYGGVTGTVVDAKLVFASALKSLATCIILIHNHPSGNLNPSLADIGLTMKLVKAGSLLDISVLDHIIITKEGYYSFADEGKMDAKD